jgi:hypothetical protein
MPDHKTQQTSKNELERNEQDLAKTMNIAHFTINGMTLGDIMKIKNQGKRKATLAAYQAALDAYLAAKNENGTVPETNPEKKPLQTLQKTQSNKVVQLPIWANTVRGVPNVALRSALFGVVKRGKRGYLERTPIASQGGITIRYTGPRLDQADLDVWEQCLHIARDHALGTRIQFGARGFLRAIHRNGSGANHEWLKCALARLAGAVVEINDGQGHTYGGALIHEFAHDDNTGQIVIEINPKLLTLYGTTGWTGVDWNQRLELGSNQLAKWLHGFYSSHSKPYPNKVHSIREWSGSQVEELWKFRQLLRESLEILTEVTAWHCDIDKDDLVRVRKPKKGLKNGM